MREVKGYIDDINQKALANPYFRQVLETGQHTQIVVMSIPQGGEIGEEVHPDTDQVLYLVSGEGKVVLDGEERDFRPNDIVLVHAGTRHNFLNTGSVDMKILTTYSPPHHPAGTIHKSKADADKAGY